MIGMQSASGSPSVTRRVAMTVSLAVAALMPLRAAGAANIAVAPGEPLQAAIDKAADGATITLGAGVYPESITIAKPLTLVGAGWDKTIIGPEGVSALTPQVQQAFLDRTEATNDPEELKRIWAEMATLVYCVKIK